MNPCQQRALLRAEGALDEAQSMGAPERWDEAAVPDLIADLLLYTEEREGRDPDEILFNATMHHQAERGEDGECSDA